jgi:6-phosphofructokinase 1
LEKKVPLEWISDDHTQMKKEFINYAYPLIQAELTPMFVGGLPQHITLDA